VNRVRVPHTVAAGAGQTAAVSDEHGWRLGRIIDPFGHEWEIGKPLTTCPALSPESADTVLDWIC
jgi:hypothetical protein